MHYNNWRNLRLTKTTLVLISGKKGAGKDYVARKLSTHLNRMGNISTILHFADGIKDLTSKLTGYDREQIETMKNCHADVFTVGRNRYNMRVLLQMLGTEFLKPIFGEDIHAKYMEHQIHQAGESIIIIPDFRFPVEYNYFAEQEDYEVITINVSDGQEGYSKDEHISENALTYFQFDIEYYNNKNVDFDIEKLMSMLTGRI